MKIFILHFLTLISIFFVSSVDAQLVISEFRTSGPSGSADEYVEIYNNSNSPITIAASGIGYALVKSGPAAPDPGIVVAIIANGTVIPARGHFLIAGGVFSLGNYGGTNAVTPNAVLSADIENDKGIALFNTSDPAGFILANRVDAVGSSNESNSLYKEGTGYPVANGSTLNYCFQRKTKGELVQDTENNSADFIFIDNAATNIGAGQRLGVPGPQNSNSPTVFGNSILITYASTSIAPNVNPNYERILSPGPNSSLGTMALRFKVQNTGTQSITRLRFRFDSITTASALPGFADLRLLTSSPVALNHPSIPPFTTAQVLTLEAPPAQPNGGGFNSSMALILGSALEPGASVYVNLLLGVQQEGLFNLIFTPEGLPFGGNNVIIRGHTSGGPFSPPPPSVTINQASGQVDPAATSPINFTAVFSKPVTGFTSSDVTLSGTAGATTKVVTEIAPNDGTTFNVAVSGMTTPGTVIATIPFGAVMDDISQASFASTSTDNTVTYSPPGSEAPTVTINQASTQADPTSSLIINFTAVFSKPVTGFTESDISFSGSTVNPIAIVITEMAPNNGTTYNVAVSGMPFSGIVLTTIPAGAAMDDLSQSSQASTSTDNTVTYQLVCDGVCPENITKSATSSSGAVVEYGPISPPTPVCNTTIGLPFSGTLFPIGTSTVNVYNNVPAQETMYALSNNNLYKINIGTSAITGPVAITGLQPGESISTIDFRPSTGQLYGLSFQNCDGGCSRLYIIDKTTGAATQVGSNVSSYVGSQEIEFDPVTDMIHIVGQSYQAHYIMNPTTGVATLASYTEDEPLIKGIAFSNNLPNAEFTTLYGLGLDGNLYTIGGIHGDPAPNMNSKILVGDLNPDPNDPPVGITAERTSFDISPRGNAWIVSGGNVLASVNLNNGAGSLLGSYNITIDDFSIEPLSLGEPACSFTVTVNPPQPPTITCPGGNITIYTDPGKCNAGINFAEEDYITITGNPAPKISYKNTFSNGSVSGFGLDVLPVIFFNVGVNTVTFTATNDEGTATCSFTVTVIDSTPPVIVCPENKVVNAEPGTCKSGLVGITLLVTEGCHVDVSTTIGLGWGVDNPTNKELTGFSTFPVGTTTVGVTATDASGNTSTCSFTVTVIDNEKPVITSKPDDVTVECTSQIPAVNISSVMATDNCGTPTITHVDDVISNQTCANKYTVTRTYRATDGSGNTATASQLITVDDKTPPTITGLTPSKRILAPPNHKMVPITLDYTVSDNCLSDPNVTINITSNEPVNGTGDGDTDPDWEIIDDHHIRLRAERSAQGTGRIYTITVTVNDGCNAPASATTEVVVAHNITGPRSGSSFRVGSTVTFTGEFWDVPGNTHTAKWLIDGSTTAKGIVTEPSGTKNGKVTGTYKFTTPGIYKLQMNITDQKGVTTYANTNGDVDAIIVVYDPNGGYTYGGGYFNSPAGALTGSPSSTGKASYGFAMNYFKNSTNPKGETQFEFKVGDFEYNALNFDYLVINKSMAQFKGTGKIIGGQSGIGFIMTVTDGQLDGTGIDKIRLKIYNKNNGKVIYDNQPGATDAAMPINAVGANSEIVIQSTNAGSPAARMNTGFEELAAESNTLNVTVMPNPSSKDFTLIARSNRVKEKIIMRVNDMYGRIIEVRQVIPGQRIQLGGNYTSGTYIVKFIQGNIHKQLKLLKISDHY